MNNFSIRFPSSAPWAPLVLFGLAVVLAGCGDSGGSRQRVSGQVTFDGRPVPAGQIMFEPDTSAGNKGPMGSAEITNGQYDTQAAGIGTVGGPHLVRITGLEGKPTDNAAVRPLFNTYETKVDLGQGPATKDFDVPAAAAEGLKFSDEPPP
jgi:hypothetical protein